MYLQVLNILLAYIYCAIILHLEAKNVYETYERLECIYTLSVTSKPKLEFYIELVISNDNRDIRSNTSTELAFNGDRLHRQQSVV